MAASANAIALTDYMLTSVPYLARKMAYTLLVNGSVLEDLPLVTKKVLQINGVRWQDNLPPVNWSAINAGTTVTKGTPTQFTEQAFAMRNAIDCDLILMEDETSIVDPRSAQLNAYLQAVAYDVNDGFINNDHVTGNSNKFVGIRYRLDNAAAYKMPTELKIDAGGVDLSDGGISSGSVNKLIEIIQSALDYMGNRYGMGCVIYSNDLVLRRLERGIRLAGTNGGFRITEDQFGRDIVSYRNAKIVDIGRKADQVTRIITNTETAAGLAGASTFSSLYVVMYGEDRLSGWEFRPLSESIQDIGLVGNDGTIARIVINWVVGLYAAHPRAFARIFNIKVA